MDPRLENLPAGPTPGELPRPRPGALIYVMGPSGAGKDSLIAKAMEANLPNLTLAPRLVTRNGHNLSPDVYVPTETFTDLERRGRLALSWASHGFLYGIDKSIETLLHQGLSAIVNGSRGYLPEARERFPDLRPVLVTADPETLKARLEKRARENGASIAERLSRTDDTFNLPHGLYAVIDNSGSLQAASEAFIALIRDILSHNDTPKKIP